MEGLLLLRRGCKRAVRGHDPAPGPGPRHPDAAPASPPPRLPRCVARFHLHLYTQTGPSRRWAAKAGLAAWLAPQPVPVKCLTGIPGADVALSSLPPPETHVCARCRQHAGLGWPPAARRAAEGQHRPFFAALCLLLQIYLLYQRDQPYSSSPAISAKELAALNAP